MGKVGREGRKGDRVGGGREGGRERGRKGVTLINKVITYNSMKSLQA